MNFESAVKFLKSFISYEDIVKYEYDEGSFNLERIKIFARGYGIDYSKLKFVHVGGSKGKGSVSSMIALYLSKRGFKTGLFTSPYMFDITECFSVDGEEISKKKFAAYVLKLKNYLEKIGGCSLTYFELLTLLVFQYFIDEKVDYAVMEVGLGGRLDATNIIDPLVSVLTSVEMEHSDILGDTIEKILDEKLGIVKRGVPFVVGCQEEKVKRIIKNKLKNNNNVFFVDDFNLKFLNGNISQAQNENAKLAYLALKKLLPSVNFEKFLGMVRNFKLVGRFDVRKIRGKTVVFDMAHTEKSISNLVYSLIKKFGKKKFIFVVSILKGKNVESILRLISKVSEKVIFTVSHGERGFSGRELRDFFVKINGNIPVEVEDDCISAYKKAFKNLKNVQVLCVTGSHFLIGKILKK